MIHFRCYFLNADEHIKAAQDFECESEANAIDRARRVFAEADKYSAFELWREGTRVHFEKRAG
jgi:hypothetical protein